MKFSQYFAFYITNQCTLFNTVICIIFDRYTYYYVKLYETFWQAHKVYYKIELSDIAMLGYSMRRHILNLTVYYI